MTVLEDPPDDDWPADQVLRDRVAKCQRVGTYLLGQFDAICHELNVDFYLSGGTLLGALRNGGWIPWDDDVDVMMLRGDYEIMRSRIRKLLPAGLTYSDPTDANHATAVARILYDASNVNFEERFGMQPPERQHLALDIFVWDRAPNSPLLRRPWTVLVRFLQIAVAARATTLRRIMTSPEPLSAKLAVSALHVTSRIVPKRAAASLPDRAASMWKRSSSQLLMSLNHSRRTRSVILTNADFQDRKAVPFEDGSYYSIRIDHYLGTLFGDDFRTPPAFESRVPHELANFSVDLSLAETTAQEPLSEHLARVSGTPANESDVK